VVRNGASSVIVNIALGVVALLHAYRCILAGKYSLRPLRSVLFASTSLTTMGANRFPELSKLLHAAIALGCMT
jgi:hypothetical protein